MAEYAILLGLIVITVLAALSVIGGELEATFRAIHEGLTVLPP